MYIANRRGNLSQGGINQPIDRPGKIGKSTKTIIFTYGIGMIYVRVTKLFKELNKK